jgi:tetratricopeptide (TPR) repeat protein
MSEEVMLGEAIEALRQGQRERARDLLTRLLRSNQQNPEYWLWMSGAVDPLSERIYCLKAVLRLDPENVAAKRGLVMMGALPPDDTIKPAPLVRRRIEVHLDAEPQEKPKIHWTRQTFRIVGLLLMGLVVIAFILAVLLTPQRKAIPIFQRPTKTPGPPPTFTPTPTYFGFVAAAQSTPTPTSEGPKPLWMLLEATYTPTPLYVNTPHVVNEAYRLGLQAFSRDNLEGALNFFQQAAKVEPSAADIFFYIGEIYRLQGNPKLAIQSYNQALSINAYFAPAYLGRGRARLSVDPKTDVSSDLDQAISNDPYFGEAYLERAAYRIAQNDRPGAEKDLQSAGNLISTSPLIYIYRAQLALLSGKADQAFQAARQAYELDRTSLTAYHILGQAALMKGDLTTAIEMLKTYLDYQGNDATAWLELGQAYAGLGNPDQVYAALLQPPGSGNFPEAKKAFDKASELAGETPELVLYHSILSLVTGGGQNAVNGFLQVRKQIPVKAVVIKESDRMLFAINLAIGRALLLSGRAQEAYGQVVYAGSLAKTDQQIAAFHFWRAQVVEVQGKFYEAIKDWRYLLSLPRSAFPTAWVPTAQSHLATLSAPTTTSTPTTSPSPSPSRTPTPSRTTRPSPTPTRPSPTP